jgi:two-component system sensor histidine kinase/response regulator
MPAPANIGRPPTILVVEDDDGHARLAERALRQNGFEVECAATSRACLEALRRLDASDLVVLLDLGLPDVPGLTVLEQIVARSEETAVIVVTGVDDITVAVGAIRRGAWDYVVKRSNLSHLAELPHVIRRNQERQRLVRERNLFRSMLSHDLRNPLHIIFNYADMIAEEAPLTPAAQLLLQRIKDNAVTTLNLIANFVELGRIEAGTLRIHARALSLRGLAQDVIDRQDGLATSRGVSLCLEAPADLPEVMADAAYMERALTNLVSNAIKFTRAGGHVVVRITAADGALAVAVSDTGAGIPADERAVIFEKYKRGRQTMALEGSGLGLFIVKSVVEAHGGRIDVQSSVGVGSTFVIQLPLTPTVHAAASLASAG